jgi:hypothetical protein
MSPTSMGSSKLSGVSTTPVISAATANAHAIELGVGVLTCRCVQRQLDLVHEFIEAIRVTTPAKVRPRRREAGDDLAVDRIGETMLGIVVPPDGHHLALPRKPGQRLAQDGLPALRFESHTPVTGLENPDVPAAESAAGVFDELSDYLIEFTQRHRSPGGFLSSETAQHLTGIEPMEERDAENLAQPAPVCLQPPERGEGVGHCISLDR